MGQQLTTLQKSLKGLSDADQGIIKQKTEYDNEELIVDGLKNEMTRAKELVDSLQSGFDDAPEEDDSKHPELVESGQLRTSSTR